MYFEKFPLTFYTQDNLATVQLVRNIFLRAVFNEDIKSKFSLYDEYDIKDGETPEILADRFYNNSLYHWVILLYNDILDPRYDWPLSTRNLISHVDSKYENPSATHHYENADGFIVNSDAPGATPISNFTYEDRLNETKRRIKILKPQYLDSVVKEFNSKIENVTLNG